MATHSSIPAGRITWTAEPDGLQSMGSQRVGHCLVTKRSPLCVCIYIFFFFFFLDISSVQFSSVSQSCLSLCNPMDCSTPGLPVHHQLPEFIQTMSIESVMPSNHLIFCHPLLLPPSVFPSIWSFLMSQFFASGTHSIGVSASASVLPMNIWD